jgi:succinate-semialdehyde dehydrogenase/glutarate-semialdehyde dehydrogenase
LRNVTRRHLSHGLKNEKLWKTSGFVNGKFIPIAGHKTFDVTNPADGSVLAKLPRMTAADCKEACTVANTAFQSWKKTTGNERSKILRKMSDLMLENQEDLARIMALESGKPMAEARGEVLYAQSFYEWYAEEARRTAGEVMQPPVKGRRMLAIKQPVGPAGMITPWNFPSAMITRKVGPALAAGCTVVIKPSEETPMSALALCAIAEMAGVPAGVINCLTVAREEVKEVGEAMCHSELLRKVLFNNYWLTSHDHHIHSNCFCSQISFTGSTAVGKWLMRESASTVKKVSLELGGNAPFIVFNDADVDVAVQALMFAKFRNAGQACIAANRVFVQEGIYKQFSEKFAAKVKGLVVGHGTDAKTTMGPLINKGGLDKVSYG